jgi:hypothetical protein
MHTKEFPVKRSENFEVYSLGVKNLIWFCHNIPIEFYDLDTRISTLHVFDILFKVPVVFLIALVVEDVFDMTGFDQIIDNL